MNHKYFYAISLRFRLPDNSRRHFLALMTTKPNKVFFDWKFVEKKSVQTSASYKLATAQSYNLLTFPTPRCVRDLKQSFAEYYKKNHGKAKNATLQFALDALDVRRANYDLPDGAVCDWFAEITGEVQP